MLLCTTAVAEEHKPAFTAEQLEFFENKIRPVLADNCYTCHSNEAKRNKGGLYLDSREGFLEGFLAVPGKVEESLFIESVRYTDPSIAMPPKGKLPDEVIKDLEKWVEMGMPWPDEQGAGTGDVFDLEARQKEHWAWHKPKRADRDEDKTIDAYIEERLEAEGIEPAPAADRATLIRRLTLDLTGLPPTPEEVQAFVDDPAADAYERLVDRLLASPRYSEKWARHWLDLMRYAESYGHEFDYSIPHAWKYRDYVIRAIHDDVPYDRFVKEHIAGDLIEPRVHEETKVNEAIKATGWWFMHEQTHSPTDVRLHEHDRMDNQIDVMTKSFLGMTVSCARCHDHKFDAISDEDYYSLMGYLQSSRQQEAYLDPANAIAKQAAETAKAVAQGQKRFASLGAKPLAPTVTEHADSALLEDFNDGSFDGWRATGWAWGNRPTVPGQWDPTSGKAMPVLPGTLHSGLLGDQAMGTIRSPEFDLSERFTWLLVKGKGTARLIIDSYTLSRHNDLLYTGIDVEIDTEGKWQWVKLGPNSDLYAGKSHTRKLTGEVLYDHRAHIEIIDDHADAHLIVDEVRFGERGPTTAQPIAIDSADTTADKNFAAITERFNASAAKMPAPERVLAITDGTPDDTYLHIRGGWHGIGEPLPRRFLTALGGEDGTLAPDDGSGRVGLARRIVDPQNPLTARVQVNRLWHHLFGRGIVPTVDNHGVLGIKPSHPELLDHLAIQFVEEDNWSNKAMIKRIVMSKAYQRTSDKQADAFEEKDPQNLLLYRQNIRRMTSEVLRDSVLAVAGSLNEQRYGPSVPIRLTAFMSGRGRPEESGPLDGDGRRSIYSSVRRNFLSPMMLAFDMPTPFTAIGNRNVTTVPAQSLTLMNDPFMHDQVRKWADRLMQEDSATVDERIDLVFKSAVGRLPKDNERATIHGFIAQRVGEDANASAVLKNKALWRELCHAALNLKGFLYIR